MHINDIPVDKLVRSWYEVTDAVTNAASTTTHSAVAGARHVVTMVSVSYDTVTTDNASLLQVMFGSTVVWQGHMTDADREVHMEMLDPSTAQDVNVVVAASGTAAIAVVTSVHGYTVDDDV